MQGLVQGWQGPEQNHGDFPFGRVLDSGGHLPTHMLGTPADDVYWALLPAEAQFNGWVDSAF